MDVVPNIQEIVEKLKLFRNPQDLATGATILVVAVGSFFLGTLYGDDYGSAGEIESRVEQKAGIIEAHKELPFSTQSEVSVNIVQDTTPTSTPEENSSTKEGGYVASKSGKKYHLPWCPGVKQIKEENKIWFKTKEEAERAGYGPASNCKGI